MNPCASPDLQLATVPLRRPRGDPTGEATAWDDRTNGLRSGEEGRSAGANSASNPGVNGVAALSGAAVRGVQAGAFEIVRTSTTGTITCTPRAVSRVTSGAKSASPVSSTTQSSGTVVARSQASSASWTSTPFSLPPCRGRSCRVMPVAASAASKEAAGVSMRPRT